MHLDCDSCCATCEQGRKTNNFGFEAPSGHGVGVDRVEGGRGQSGGSSCNQTGGAKVGVALTRAVPWGMLGKRARLQSGGGDKTNIYR